MPESLRSGDEGGVDSSVEFLEALGAPSPLSSPVSPDTSVESLEGAPLSPDSSLVGTPLSPESLLSPSSSLCCLGCMASRWCGCLSRDDSSGKI